MVSDAEFRELFAGKVSDIAIGSYPDGMPLMAGPDVDFTTRVMLRPKSLMSFMAAMFWVDAYQERTDSTIELVLPFVPGARQDRLNDSGDYLFTAKSIAREINERRFSRVTVIDPHSDVTPALINNCRVIPAADCIVAPPGKYTAVVSPDAGAEKRAGAVARKLGVPLIHGWKTRDVATGAINGFGMQTHSLPPDALALVVDDICDGGGTFEGLADVLDAVGLKAHLFVTHGLFTKGAARLLERYQGHVYCTDSVIAERPGVIEIKVCEKLLREGTL